MKPLPGNEPRRLCGEFENSGFPNSLSMRVQAEVWHPDLVSVLSDIQMHLMLRTFAKTLLLACGLDAAQAGELEDIAEQAASKAPNYALGVAYAENGAKPVTMTFGPIHKNTDTPVSTDAQWHIGSITKSFTAALIMRLVDRGTLSLDAPVEDYLPKDKALMHAQWRALTLRQLLSHTSGLPANAPMEHFSKRSNENLHDLRREILAALWISPLSDQTGAYLYSNLGYLLAGFVAEEATGKPWEKLVLDELAVPLDLKSLGFGAPVKDGAPWGHGGFVLFKREVSPQADITDNPPWLGPAGTIHLSLNDLVLWGQAHLAACKGEADQFLSAKSCLAMQEIIAENYGLGWVIEDNKDPPHIWHNGSNTMWYAKLVILPDQDRVLAAATNVFHARRIDRLLDDMRLSND
ncbi:serine hydrolase domain-containing protein [Hoeflea prorocentri]|uniref:Serine hydrolase n=1 Tax=Hoeflea prorocentri TaxID=1922333 RepID=A0A9X3UIP2_9HYPH|nr:serine hydrolase domain-containing protein [Hoeflea prorocentri]MCY6382098.1 serine hydrolase [Hoeflea prorocentri]MDA5399898.1 serine hydrolase [Hoeflea prorocentri]